MRVDRRGRRGAGRPRRPGGALAGRDGELRDRPRDQAPAAQRARRHRADARAGARRSTPTSATASVRARSRRRCERASPRLGRGDLRPRLGHPAALGARAARAAASCAATRSCSTPAAARAGSPRCSPTASRTAACTASTSRRRWSTPRPGGARRPRHRSSARTWSSSTLPEPVDAVFSNATFHWIHDHDALFARLHEAIKPGGQLVAQCGGRGNIDAFRVLADAVAATDEFSRYFADWQRPWNYAGAEETTERLERAGFTDVETAGSSRGR